MTGLKGDLGTIAELQQDRERRLRNQRVYPFSFVSCSCQRGCAVCAYTGLISRAEAKRIG
jgi:hypothetical protein